MELDEVKERVADDIDRRADRLLEISHAIHDKPELNFEEHFAHDLLCDEIDAAALEAERHAFGLDTAFVARAGSKGTDVAVCLEYDALPGIGHACGHNIIAAAGLGAGLATAAVADECGGRLSILGTPAEEGGGGKVFMIRAGAFEQIDAAVMIHPAGAELRDMTTLAVQQCVATYDGAAAHAAAAPHEGRNALDAAVLGYNGVAALRQHILPSERIHGVFTDGGDKPNIVPARAQTHWFVRSPSAAGLDSLKERVVACLRAGATATGCEVSIEWVDPPYADMVGIGTLNDLYAANAARLDRTVLDPAMAADAGVAPVVGSTDMGDVSYVVPSIHPMIQAAPDGTPIHTPAFAAAACGPMGDRAVIDGAKILAWTVVDLWLVPGAIDAARSEFEARLSR
ncbi:M20 family metallopeptidase [Actinospongicola halichondriae]|uniref:M20 family metallopeptidase n=1 Tax=Actinospongicola halichondriae TaxID=3236844 RepID=UPI003D55CAB7